MTTKPKSKPTTRADLAPDAFDPLTMLLATPEQVAALEAAGAPTCSAWPQADGSVWLAVGESVILMLTAIAALKKKTPIELLLELSATSALRNGPYKGPGSKFENDACKAACLDLLKEFMGECPHPVELYIFGIEHQGEDEVHEKKLMRAFVNGTDDGMLETIHTIIEGYERRVSGEDKARIVKAKEIVYAMLTERGITSSYVSGSSDFSPPEAKQKSSLN